MHLIWEKDFIIGLFGSLYFIGFFFGSAFFLRFADIKGRRKIVMIGIIGTVLCGLIIFVTNSLILTYLALFIFGIFVSVRVLVSYLYAMELVPQKKKKFWNLIAALTDAVVMISVAGYFYIIKYGESTIVFYLVFSIISLIFVYRAPESPQFLYTKKRWEELHSSFSKISRINNKEWSGFKFDREELRMHEFNIKSSCSSMISDRKTFKNLMIMIINWSSCSFSYYLLSYYTKYFKGTIYSNTALLGLADILATFSMRIMQNFFETKTSFMISFSLVFVVSWFYYIVMHEVVLVAIWVLLMRYGVTTAFSLAYYGNSEYFQTDMVSTAFGACNTMARLSTIVSPMLAEVLAQPIILITFWTLVSAITSFFLIKPLNILESFGENSEDNAPDINENLPDIVRDYEGESNLNQNMPNEEEKQTEPDADNSYQDSHGPHKNSKPREKFIIMEDDGDEDQI
jgi:MFS transporter, OCT family, solute carrier family 22 (organic cation transporter), member 4/5